MKAKSILTIVGAFLAVMFIPGGVANASELSPEIEQAVERVNDGTWTKADLALIRSEPSVAKNVPDPTKAGSDSGSRGGFLKNRGSRGDVAGRDIIDGGSDGGLMGAGADASCPNPFKKRWSTAWFRRKSLLGTTIYKYHHRVDYCTGGGKIRNFINRYDFLSEQDSIIYIRERTLNQTGGVGDAQTWSKMQRHVEYCVPVGGCYANTYPWVKLVLRYNGLVSYDGSA